MIQKGRPVLVRVRVISCNTRIIKSAAKLLDIPLDKFFINVDRYGNTSAASIPIALCEAVEEGQVKDGDRLVLVGFGGGLSWAAMLIEWGPGERMPQT